MEKIVIKKKCFFFAKSFLVFRFWTFLKCPFCQNRKQNGEKKVKKVIVTIMLCFPFFGFSVCDDNFFFTFFENDLGVFSVLIYRTKWA